ncbi:MAG: Fic family protein [Mariprofundaceae bacterium]|nr:Fic family protein [Mariprofundaceae bacterium]
MRYYTPPFQISSQVLSLVADICEMVGQKSAQEDLTKPQKKDQRSHCIQGCLALEGNNLDQTQITSILAGQNVTASLKDIQEAYHLNNALNHLLTWQKDSEKDLCDAHKIITMHLMDEQIHGYRKHDLSSQHPPASRVPLMVLQLLDWLSHTKDHPLIVSCIFHYEFQLIQPFSQSNARMARLWQNLILAQWNPLFHNLPIEAMIHQHQESLKEIPQDNLAEPLTTETLKMISIALKLYRNPQEKSQTSEQMPQEYPTTPSDSSAVTPQVNRLLHVMQGEMTREKMQEELGLSDRKSFRLRYIVPALQAGLIEMTIPDKPNSKAQKYRKTLK